ncbi:MAG: TolC family protein, partial [Polaromonas sp.]
MPRRHIACLFVAILFLGNLAHGQIGSAALSSSDLVQMAIERNREFLAAKQRIAETRGLLRQAGVRPSPTVEVQEAIGPGEEQFSVGYFHTLETFGKRAKRTFVAKKSAELAEVEVADRIRQLTFEVKVRHAEAVAEQRKRRAINRLLGLNREYYRVTEARVEQGDAAPLEQQLLLTDLNRMEAQQLVLAARGERALLELRKIVGLAASEPLALPEDLAPAAVEVFLAHLLEQAAQNRPDLRLLQLLEEQVMAEVDLARAEAKPDITTSIRYSRSKTSFDQFGFNRAGQLVPL